MKVAVITPTIGSGHFWKCVESVQEQDYLDVSHYVFIDGQDYKTKVEDTLFCLGGKKRVATINLSENIGKGWYGHRAYAASSFLVNADVLCYLDEDNWLEPNHVSSLVKILRDSNVPWAYSLRKIFKKDGTFACEDNCESLGLWPIYFHKDQYHIDTSCFAVRQRVAVQIGQAWYGQWGADRQFFGALKHYFPGFKCSQEYSLCYRLDGNPGSVNEEFFIKGNMENLKNYKTFPWKVKDKI